MRRQRDAAFTDEIITNIKQFQTDTDCDKPDERTVSHAKEKTVNPIVTGQKNVGQLGNNRAHRDGSISVTERYIRPSKVPYLRAFRAFCRQRKTLDQTLKIALSEHINRSGRRVE